MRSRLIVYTILFAVLSLFAGPFPQTKADQSTTPSVILANPSRYDGQHLTVTGKVTRIQAKVSQRGNDYDIFDLCDSSCIRVFVFGDPSIYEGEHLAVHAVYSRVTHVSGYTFYNEIRADDGSL
jgi:hypothetical protein